MIGAVKGTGSSIPWKVVSNSDLSLMVETDDQWIRERTGVRNRHVVTRRRASGETTSSMAIEAGRSALDNSGVDAADLDMILVATISSDVIMPNTACVVQQGIGATKAVCFDLNSACSGFIFAYNTAQVYIEAGMAKHVLVIGAESLSRWVDWKDRGTCILFGDGAGAVVLSAEEGQGKWSEHLHTVMHGNGDKGEALTCNTLAPNDVSNHDFQMDDMDTSKYYIQMDGQAVFKFAVRQVPIVIEELLLKMDMQVEDVDIFLLHQANQRIVEAVSKRLKCPMEKFPMNLQEYGNTSSASIPILLDEWNRSGRLQSGMKIIMAGFGAGLTWGATYLEWE